MTEKCFAMRRRCMALDKAGCEGCAFYKTKAQNDADRQAAWDRIRSLPLDRQQEIAGNYYNGQMPWYGDEVRV